MLGFIPFPFPLAITKPALAGLVCCFRGIVPMAFGGGGGGGMADGNGSGADGTPLGGGGMEGLVLFILLSMDEP